MRIPAVDALNMGLIANWPARYYSYTLLWKLHFLTFQFNFRLCTWRLLTGDNTCGGCFKNGANSHAYNLHTRKIKSNSNKPKYVTILSSAQGSNATFK
jgi:hypothetical protein